MASVVKKPETPKKSLAQELHESAQKRVEFYLNDTRSDERQWAEDILPQVITDLRRIALSGGFSGVVDIPESDIHEAQFLRGGGADLKKRLESDGFSVALGRRYNGHPAGEFHLIVSW